MSLNDPAVAHLRRLVLFLLGTAVVIDALFQTGPNVPELVVGLVLLGLVTVDDFFSRLPLIPSRRRNGPSPPTPPPSR